MNLIFDRPRMELHQVICLDRPSEFLLYRFLILNEAGMKRTQTRLYSYTHTLAHTCKPNELNWNESHKHRPKMNAKLIEFSQPMVLAQMGYSNYCHLLVIILFSIQNSIIIKWHKEKLHIKWITIYWMFYKLSARYGTYLCECVCAHTVQVHRIILHY